MKKLFVFVATVVAALGVTAAANAGCMATVGLSSTPKPGLAAGKPWVVTIRVLQHGRTPMPDAKPEVRIRNAAGKLFTFKAKKTATSSVRIAPGSSSRRRAATRSASTTASPSPSARACTRSSRC